MRVIGYLVTGLALAVLPARADDTGKPAVQSDVNRGVDANTPKAPDHHGKVERHWDPDHVEAKERSSARNDVVRSTKSKKVRPETTEEHRKVEKRADGSTRSEVEKTHSYDDGSGETKDHEKTVTDSKDNDQGGRTVTREVNREHDAPGSANDHKTHVKEKIEKDAKGNVIKRERSE
jgi:hypothetical protein